MQSKRVDTLEIIYILQAFINNIDIKQYILIGSTKIIPEQIYYESLFTLGTLCKIYVDICNVYIINIHVYNEYM